MAGNPDEEELYMLYNRNQSESARLNNQHKLIQLLSGSHLILPQVNLGKIESIADVATGTGVWIFEVHDQLTAVPTNTGSERIFHAFDISDVQYPKQQDKVQLTVHDITKPFPLEYHGRFDLVHVRLLLFAIRASELPKVIENLIQILAPGGYIQWDDFYTEHMGYNVPKTGLNELTDLVYSYAADVGFSGRLPDLVKEELEKQGLHDTFSAEYSSLSKPEAIDATKFWYRGTIKALVPVALRRSGHSDEEVAQKLGGIDKRIDTAFENGVVPDLRVAYVLAKRPV
ncbi:hypothetical protein Plec18167_008715 [Paecilomyces lecythidis]|uniref:Methyltransferase domain-containing protein n=1 Tax=Paecilomyces lecythidis TaxID=3004212 RepID=A0ABR3WU20_9EURO